MSELTVWCREHVRCCLLPVAADALAAVLAAGVLAVVLLAVGIWP